MPRVWAGVDAGKGHHHCVAIDEEGTRLLSKRFANDESEILGVLSAVADLAAGDELIWATDLNQGGSALLIAVLAAHGQNVVYLPGRTVHHAARTYRGDGKTDAKDAAIIADQARMRRDLQYLAGDDAIARDLRLLTAHRTDLVCDRTRAVNRLRATLLEFFPGLEASFDFARRRGALLLLTRFQTPEALRRHGVNRIAAWLAKQGCVRVHEIAQTAVDAAKAQLTAIPGETAGAAIVARLAHDVLRLIDEISDVEAQMESKFLQHPHAEIVLSMPGFGPLLAAEFLAAIGGSPDRFESADRLAGVAGLAPAPRDSGRVSGNNHRPKRYDRRLLRACYLAAQIAARYCPDSRAYYERKRAEGKVHKQAVLALARRRLNVLWAMLRDETTFRAIATA